MPSSQCWRRWAAVTCCSGRDLSGCSDGFLLVLAPYAGYSAETAAARITRAQCLDMNAYAADLATVTLA